MWLTRLRIAAGVTLFLGTVLTATSLALYSGAGEGLSRGPEDGRSVEPLARTETSRPPLDLLRAEDIPADKRLDGLPKKSWPSSARCAGRHAGEVRGLAISRDGKLLVTVADQDRRSASGTRRLFNHSALSPDTEPS